MERMVLVGILFAHIRDHRRCWQELDGEEEESGVDEELSGLVESGAAGKLSVGCLFRGFRCMEGFPNPVSGSQIASVRAVFEIRPDKWTEELGVWTGQITSDAKKLIFYHYKQ